MDNPERDHSARSIDAATSAQTYSDIGDPNSMSASADDKVLNVPEYPATEAPQLGAGTVPREQQEKDLTTDSKATILNSEEAVESREKHIVDFDGSSHSIVGTKPETAGFSNEHIVYDNSPTSSEEKRHEGVDDDHASMPGSLDVATLPNS